MPRRESGKDPNDMEASLARDYRHVGAKRKNVPPATMASEGQVPRVPKARYEYSPHLSPTLRFDDSGDADNLTKLLAEAGRRALRPDELSKLADILRRQEPWMEWAGRRESDSRAGGGGALSVDPVALMIHERVSAQAVLRVAARQDVARDLFADPEQDYRDAVQFYRHDVDWANRLILGDSLQVMSSLARRESLAGKVQMVYLDPPYGIRFASNFQPEVGQRDVKDREEDLTREPETVKAYRDTWSLGVHSYLAYLRDRFIVARELLTDSGSIFVQISEENLHRVRMLLDGVFGPDNFCSVITYQKTGWKASELLSNVADYIVWYARDRRQLKFKAIWFNKLDRSAVVGQDLWAQKPTGERVRVSGEVDDEQARFVFRHTSMISAGHSPNSSVAFDHEGRSVHPGGNQHWKTTPNGLRRLAGAGRLLLMGNSLRFVNFISDFSVSPVTTIWTDTVTSGFADPKVFVVQSATKAVSRCMLMTTEPGDLVVDPTCGSGTTAVVAEQWGRRWITIDTSRVAISIARQRLLTAKFDFYAYRDERRGISGGLRYKTVPHVMLKSIAQNANLDPIFAKHEPILEEHRRAANAALGSVTDEVRTRLLTKLVEKQRRDGRRALTDSDRRRWELPKVGSGWDHWQIPFDTDLDWPEALRSAVEAYRRAWRAKMDEVSECVAANAEHEELVDQPEVARGVVRVTGPFTVESVQPPEVSVGEERFAGSPDALAAAETGESGLAYDSGNVRAYLAQMYSLLRRDGVRFLNNKQMTFSRLDALFESGRSDLFHAEGRWAPAGEQDFDSQGPATVGVIFGPQYGPISARMVEDSVRPAARRYEDLVLAGFAFDGPAQEAVREASHPKLRIHIAHIRPDVNPGMAGLLREQPNSQLFTVFGQPRVRASRVRDEWEVSMDGVDVYDPVSNVVLATRADKVAAWFLDGDYDGRTFCITQAFFPDKSAWDKLARALKGVLDEERFAAMSGTVSLPFPAGKFQRAAVKVIDPRGNEVMATVLLKD